MEGVLLARNECKGRTNDENGRGEGVTDLLAAILGIETGS